MGISRGCDPVEDGHMIGRQPVRKDRQKRQQFYRELAARSLANGSRNPFYATSDWFQMRGHLRLSSLLNSTDLGSLVLDAGCGPGFHLKSLQNSTHFVVGLDFEPTFLRCAKQDAREAEVLAASLEDAPLRAEIFDTVLCLGVIEHIETPSRGLQEISRVLKPGGRLILLVPNHFSLLSVIFALYHRLTNKRIQPEGLMSHGLLLSILSRLRFHLLKLVPWNYHIWLAPLDRVSEGWTSGVIREASKLHTLNAILQRRLLAQFLSPEFLIVALKDSKPARPRERYE